MHTLVRLLFWGWGALPHMEAKGVEDSMLPRGQDTGPRKTSKGWSRLMSQKGEGKMGSVARPVKGLCAQSSGQLCSCSEVEDPAGKPSNVPLAPPAPAHSSGVRKTGPRIPMLGLLSLGRPSSLPHQRRN